jgi:DNA polymerase
MKTEMLNIMRAKCEKCKACGLCKTRSNVVFSDGNAETAKVVLVGEAPGEMEDETGRPFVGRAGQLLNQFIANAGISREEDLYIINTVKCRPPKNRVPSEAEQAACRKYLEAQIAVINPRAVLLCGATALKAFCPTDKKTTISKVRGSWFDITVEGKVYPAMAIFHPSYLLRNHSAKDGSPRRLMEQDLSEVKNARLADVCHDIHKIAFGGKELALV